MFAFSECWICRHVSPPHAAAACCASRVQVSELSAFWLLSLFPQLPLVVYLSVGQMKVGGFLPLDLAAGILLMGIVVSGAAAAGAADCALLLQQGCATEPVSAPRPPSLRLLQVAQLWHGYAAIGAFIRKQTADFTRLCQEDLLASLAEQEGAAFAGAGGTASTQQQQQALYGAGRRGAVSPQPVPPELPSMAQVAVGGARHLAAAASAVLFAQSAASAAAPGRPPLHRRGGTGGSGAEGGTGIELPMTSTQRLGGRGGQPQGAGHEKVG